MIALFKFAVRRKLIAANPAHDLKRMASKLTRRPSHMDAG
jgi:hypothetical protein